MGSPSGRVISGCGSPKDSAEPGRKFRPVRRRNDLRAGQLGGAHEQRPRVECSLARHHHPGLEDGGGSQYVDPNPATEVAGGSADHTPGLIQGYCGPGRGQSQRYLTSKSGGGTGLGKGRRSKMEFGRW